MINYKPIYNAAAKSVTLRDTEIERLQRIIYDMLPHTEAAAIIDAAPRQLQRNVIRDTEMNQLKQKLDEARATRDTIVAQKSEDVIGHAHRVVAAQGAVNQAKKALYIHLRANGSDVAHRDI